MKKETTDKNVYHFLRTWKPGENSTIYWAAELRNYVDQEAKK